MGKVNVPFMRPDMTANEIPKYIIELFIIMIP